LFHHHHRSCRRYGDGCTRWSDPAGFGAGGFARRSRSGRRGDFGFSDFCPPLRPISAPAEETPQSPTAEKQIQLRVCTGHTCTQKGGGIPLVEALKREIVRRGEEARFDVRPGDCLGACDKGPSVLAVYGTAADAHNVSIYHADAKRAKGIVDDILAEIRSEETL
jgi:(2Fe-2S) ferredoxin